MYGNLREKNEMNQKHKTSFGRKLFKRHLDPLSTSRKECYRKLIIIIIKWEIKKQTKAIDERFLQTSVHESQSV